MKDCIKVIALLMIMIENVEILLKKWQRERSLYMHLNDQIAGIIKAFENDLKAIIHDLKKGDPSHGTNKRKDNKRF